MNVSTVTTTTAHRSEEYGSEWEVYWYEKNLQGDIVAVYDEMGVLMGMASQFMIAIYDIFS